MFRGLLDNRNKDEAHEVVWYASIVDDMVDFLDEEHS